MSPTPTSKPPSWKLFGIIWLGIIALTIGSFVLLWQRFGSLGPNVRVFRQTAVGWQTLPPLGCCLYDLRISDSGVVWVRSVRGLSRLDHDSWRSFTAADFGTQRPDLQGGFVLDGDDLWAAASEGIVHFDGNAWRLHAYTVATKDAASIAAAHGNVWVVDRGGNLSHFDGAAWTIQKLNFPGVEWSVWSLHKPQLAITDDGTLWLLYQGLWRFNGKSWTQIGGVTLKAELLGVTSSGEYPSQEEKIASRGGIWLSDGEEIHAFDVDGKQVLRYTARELGSTKIHAVAGRPPVFVAGGAALALFDGSQWRRDRLGSIGLAGARSVAVAPDGSVWGVGYPDLPNKTLFDHAALWASFALPLIALLFPFYWWRRRARFQRQAAREALLHATGNLPDHLQAEPSRWKSAGGIVVLIFLGGAGYGLLKVYWPAAPVWILPAAFLAVHLISTFLGSLKKRTPLPSDPIGPGGPPRYDWAKSLPTALGGLALIVLFYGNSIARHFHIPWIAAVPGIVLLFGGQLLFGLYDYLRVRPIHRELSRGNYSRAFELLNGPLSWPSTGVWKNASGEVLFFSDRAREAEPIVRELAETQRDSTLRTVALDDLGRILIAQRRYDEAKRAFEASARLTPTRSRSYSGLAELRLLQGIEAQQALEDAERALQLHRKLLARRNGAREYLADIRGNQAWALAVLGRGAESQQAIDEGLREVDSSHKPSLAGFYWRAGMAMLALGNTTTAVTRFRRSAELDRDGYYGKLAARQLSEHSVWGVAGITPGSLSRA